MRAHSSVKHFMNVLSLYPCSFLGLGCGKNSHSVYKVSFFLPF